MLLYFVPQGSCYLEIVRVKYRGSSYFKAHVRWYSRPGMKYMCEERSLKIPNEAKRIWRVLGRNEMEVEGVIQ